MRWAVSLGGWWVWWECPAQLADLPCLAALWAIDMEKAQTLENSFLLPANALLDDVGIIDTEELN